MMGAVSASEAGSNNSTDLAVSSDVDEIVTSNNSQEDIAAANDVSNEIIAANASGNDKTASFGNIPKKTNYLTGDSFNIKLMGDGGKGLANKTVYFKLGNQLTEILTDSSGVAKLPLSNYTKGTYTITFIFNETGYDSIKGSKKIFLMTTPVSTIKAPAFKAYAGVRHVFKVALKADGMALAGRTVKFIVDKRTYYKKTNVNGLASVAVYLTRGTHYIKYFWAGETGIKSCKNLTKLSVGYLGNPYKTKYRTVVIDSDGGFTRAFLNDVAKKLRTAGWRVIVKGIGPEQHSINYYKVKNAVYIPFYNGMCAATIKEMAYSYYGGLMKRNGAVLAPAFYTKGWTNPQGMLPYRYDITKLKFLKRAWDDNFSPKSFKGLAYPAEYMTKNNVHYTVGDSAYMIVEQFLYGGWVAHHKKMGLI